MYGETWSPVPAAAGHRHLDIQIGKAAGVVGAVELGTLVVELQRTLTAVVDQFCGQLGPIVHSHSLSSTKRAVVPPEHISEIGVLRTSKLGLQLDIQLVVAGLVIPGLLFKQSLVQSFKLGHE